MYKVSFVQAFRNEQIDSIDCAAHLLHLVVTKAIALDTDLKSAIASVRAVCRFVNKSTTVRKLVKAKSGIKLSIVGFILPS
jgi:hypothetical protein